MLERDISILTRAIEALTKAIKDSQPLIASPVVDPAPEPEAVEPKPADLPPSIDPVDDPAPTLSDEQVKDLLLQMSRAGKSKELKAKLAKLGVGLFSSLKGDARQAFVDWLVDLAERS
tara:strand:+ start:230 stop:583 length:354 start_codon:yes stop_codon:yes gene_type:complete